MSLPGRRTVAEAAILGLAAFVLYAAGASQTIYVGDSGELVTAAATLGIPHPSGYPLYVLLGWLWIHLAAVGSAAFRMSLFSAACAAGAVAGMHLLVRRSTGSRVAGLFAAGLLAVGPSFWSQANVQRVYALGILLLVAVLALVNQWLETRDIRWLAAAALVTGLGASNHTVMGVIGIAIGVAVLFDEPALLRRPRAIAACVGSAIVGLLPYLYLPLRSRQNPLLDWGNPETLDAFFAVVSRRDFWNRRYLESAADLVPILGDWLASVGIELLGIGAILAIVGVRVARRFGWPASLPLAVVVANVVAVALHGSRSDLFVWHRYYLPSYTALVLLAGLGLATLLPRLGRWAPAVLAVPLLAAIVAYPRWDRSGYRIADDFARTLLSTLPPGAHLAASDDNVLFVLIYLKKVEGLRPDVDLVLQGVGGELPPLHFDPDVDPLYFTHYPNWTLPQLEEVPVGLAFRVVRRGVRPPIAIPKTRLDGEDDPGVPKDYLTQNLLGHFHSMLGMTFEERDWPRAEQEFERAMAAAPRNDVLFFNLGLIYQRQGLVDRALAAFARSAEINPRHIPSGTPVRPIDKQRELEREVARTAAVEKRLRAAAGLGESHDPETLRRLAILLDETGEPVLARGQVRLAEEAEASR